MNFDMKYGLIALLPMEFSHLLEEELEEYEDGFAIVHFCGYQVPPSEDDREKLQEELERDFRFGLTEVADKIIIKDAESELVQLYKDMINNGEIEVDLG